MTAETALINLVASSSRKLQKQQTAAANPTRNKLVNMVAQLNRIKNYLAIIIQLVCQSHHFLRLKLIFTLRMCYFNKYCQVCIFWFSYNVHWVLFFFLHHQNSNGVCVCMHAEKVDSFVHIWGCCRVSLASIRTHPPCVSKGERKQKSKDRCYANSGSQRSGTELQCVPALSHPAPAPHLASEPPHSSSDPTSRSRHGAPPQRVHYCRQESGPADLEDRKPGAGPCARELSWELLHWGCLCDSLHCQTKGELFLPPPLLAG